MITIKNLTKIFRTEELETSALSGINLQINEGDFLSIMGPSGCGKSTLLNIVGLLDSASGEL
jgi:putative ABC transport system ATP-binding protein